MTTNQDFPVRRALISVSDKSKLAEFAKKLHGLGIEIVSTGGTAAHLRDQGIPVVAVSDVTGFPEILDGRVKTLHPGIHGGILANLGQPGTQETLDAHKIAAIGLVVANLYPFEEAAQKKAGDVAAMIEEIDIGGSALLRASAKNHACVTVVTDPADYDVVIQELSGEARTTTLATRRRLAAKAFARTAAYDSAIASWFAGTTGENPPAAFFLTGKLRQSLRYGENPHQNAAVYESAARTGPSLVRAELVQGKELSYNNLTDADSAFELISEFPAEKPAIAIIKHANPCGTATGATVIEAYRKAFACDSVSAFGGIVASNQPLDEEAAQEILKIFTEVVIAPAASEAAKKAFLSKPNVRLLLTGALMPHGNRAPYIRSLSGGFLVQDADAIAFDEATLKTVSKREPTPEEMTNLLFAWRVAKHVKSNAIVFAKDGATLGVGAGQMSRVDSARIAVWKAEEAAKAQGKDPREMLVGSAVASDAFFPFPDAMLVAADAGATAVIHPGGSIRDDKVLAAADERGLAMVVTGVRHFRH
jgi:phosphoribosylaminoimidazolecarboxamide formyltransferase / IMP cyclohydrolase